MALLLSVLVLRDVMMCRGQLACLCLKLKAPRSFQTSGYVTLLATQGNISEDQNARQVVPDFATDILFSFCFRACLTRWAMYC